MKEVDSDRIREPWPSQWASHTWLLTFQRASLSKLGTTINYVKLEESLGRSLIGKWHRILVQGYRNPCNDAILRNCFSLSADERWYWWNCRRENPRTQKNLQGGLFSLDVLVFAFVLNKFCFTVLSALGLLSRGTLLPAQPRGSIQTRPDVHQPFCSITSFPDLSVLVEQKGDRYLEENNWYSTDWHCLRYTSLLCWPYGQNLSVL